MATGRDVVAGGYRALSFVHFYDTGSHRTIGDQGYADCSGFSVISVRLVAPDVAAHMPTNSADQARWCRDHGQMIPVSRALRTPGALLFMGPNGNPFNGYGPVGHVAVSVGDGVHTLEARGHHATPQVGLHVATGRAFCAGGLMPGIGNDIVPQHQPGVDWAGIAIFIAACKRSTLRHGSRGVPVGVLQRRLSDLGFTEPGMVDLIAANAVFGDRTEHQVRRFQGAKGIGVDGVCGPVTWGRLFP